VALVSGTTPYVYVQLREAKTGLLRATLIDETARRTQEDTPCSHLSFINSMSFSPDGQLLVTASSEGKTKLWTVATGKLNAALSNGGIVFKAIFSPDGATLATLDNSGSDGEHTVKLWTVATANLKAAMTVKGFTREFFSDRMFDIEEIAFSPDGSLLMASSRKMVRLMDVKSGEVIGTLEGARAPATFSPDGKSLATTGIENRSVLLWEVFRPDTKSR
jgi:WD40 repeat protein